MIDIHRFIINLPERRDRRIEMEGQLQRVGWAASFEPAVRPISADGFPSTGARGCFLSHLAVLERGNACGGHVLIMEDDLNFVPGFVSAWQRAMQDLKATRWSIFYPGHIVSGMPEGLAQVPSDQSLVCAHFLMIHRDAVQILINGLKTILSRAPGHPDGGPQHVDGAYSTIRGQNPDLITYAFSPSLGNQRASRSDIASLKFFDRIEVLRPIVSRLRRLKRV